MGSGSWDPSSYSNYKTSYSSKSTSAIFQDSSLDAKMDPKGLVFRESRDSDAHPNSVAIMVMLDVTGSMGSIPEYLIRHKLGDLMETLIAHKVPDAHVLFGAIGDQSFDDYPIQVGQFEAGTDELNLWLSKIVLERGGGGDSMETYPFAWLIGARHTSIDCFEKRNQKGFLFTIGDEAPHITLYADSLEKFLGYPEGRNIDTAELLQEVQRSYNVYHLHIQEGSYRDRPEVIEPWRKLLGERLILVEDKNTVAETIATIVAVLNGANLSAVTNTFDSSTALAVTNAVTPYVNSLVNINKDSKVVTL